MRWHFSSHGHDPRLIDLVATVALIIAVVAGCEYLKTSTQVQPSASTLIEPSQTVHW